MAYKARVVTLAGTPVLIATGISAHHVVRLNPDVDILVGGTSDACFYPLYGSTDITSDREEFCLIPGDKLWATGTGDVPVLESGI